jgi:Transcriptional regulator PadR-like family
MVGSVGKQSRDGLMTFDAALDSAILDALRGPDLSAFEIRRRLASDDGTQSRPTEALLYPTLYHLEAEGLIGSDWREGEITRRKYHLTENAARGDDEKAGAQPAVTRDPRTVSADPEAGSWSIPPKREPPASTTATAPSAAGQVVEERAPTVEDVATAAYADDLSARLDLPRVELARVRQEIADHLFDSAGALELKGHGHEEAAREAARRLGPAGDLASAIERAEQTPRRWKRGLIREIVEVVGEMVIWLGISVGAIILAPGLADMATGLGRVAGLHLAVFRSAEWAMNQIAIVLCIGAFSAGRGSLGRLARITRHSEATLRKRWAGGGAAALLAVVLLLPGYPDALTVATLIAVPIAFAAGTLRPQQLHEGAYSLRWLAAGALLVAVLTLLPCGRLFAYDPNGTPGTPIAAAGSNGTLSATQNADGTWAYNVTGPAGASSTTVEFWPAATDGAFVVVDRAAVEPAISVKPGSAVDLAKLPPVREWWVVAVATNTDGTRTALAMTIQTGTFPAPSNALSWLISRR